VTDGETLPLNNESGRKTHSANDLSSSDLQMPWSVSEFRLANAPIAFPSAMQFLVSFRLPVGWLGLHRGE
jgi:hypothetical protein